MSREVSKNRERFDHSNEERAVFKSERGLSEEVIEEISREKDEPEWMTKRRLKAFRHFQQRDMPDWGPDLSGLDIDEITPYLKADDTKSDDWDEIPDDIKETFDRLGIPEAEKEALAAVGGQYES
ncbi:MAG: hypothetical protein ABEJ66_00575 [Candidatus Nanohaloarchaea archaeon]